MASLANKTALVTGASRGIGCSLNGDQVRFECRSARPMGDIPRAEPDEAPVSRPRHRGKAAQPQPAQESERRSQRRRQFQAVRVRSRPAIRPSTPRNDRHALWAASSRGRSSGR